MRIIGFAVALASASLLGACQTASSGASSPLANFVSPQKQSFNDTTFEMKSCEITSERSAICRMTVTNRFRDKKIEIGRGIKIQDNTGTDYPVTAGGFGDPSTRPKWNQIAVADSVYQVTVIATNLSSRATSIRAVIFPRLLVRTTQGRAIGYRDKVIFSRPAMVASRPVVANQPQSTPPTQVAPSETGTPKPASKSGSWRTVGYWNYDAADGQHLPVQGLVLRRQEGANLGQQWQEHLELKNHNALSPRNRSLWPVKLHTGQRKICANYPGYPSYQAFIDMPGDVDDGVYSISQCSGG